MHNSKTLTCKCTRTNCHYKLFIFCKNENKRCDISKNNFAIIITYFSLYCNLINFFILFMLCIYVYKCEIWKGEIQTVIFFIDRDVLCRSMGPCRTFVCREKLRSLCWKPELGLFGLFSTIRCPTRPCRSATGFPIASPNRSFTPTLTPTCVFLIPELCAFSIFYILIPHSATTLRCQHISPNLCLRG